MYTGMKSHRFHRPLRLLRRRCALPRGAGRSGVEYDDVDKMAVFYLHHKYYSCITFELEECSISTDCRPQLQYLEVAS